MRREPAWRRYLRFWGPDPASDIDDELEFHLQTKIEQLVAAGMAPAEARREARRQFGPMRRVRHECYLIARGRQAKASRTEYLAGWWRDVKYGVRALRGAGASTATAILILAIGIGANTAVFTVLDRLLFRSLPVPQPSQLVLISNSDVGESGKRAAQEAFTYDAYVYLRDHNRTFSGLAAEATLSPGEHRGRQKIDRPARARVVSGNFFEVLGRPALLGRALAPPDDMRSAASLVAVLGYRFWNRRYNRAPDVLGQAIYLQDLPFTIVGVMPEGFFGIHKGADPDLYIPAGSLPSLFSFATEGRWFSLFGRLRPSTTPETAQSNLQVLLDQLVKTRPVRRWAETAAARIEIQDGSGGTAGASGEKRRSLLLLASIVALLLVMGCANVACLLMARGSARRHETAIRLSLGAGKARVLRQSLIESCLLALAGGAAGLAVALGADRLLLVAFQWQERPINLAPDWRVLAFGLGLSLATGVVFGLAPALESLRGGRMALGQDRTVAPRFVSGKVLAVAEVALSLILVAGALVFLRSFQNLRSVPTGFSAEHVSVVELASTSDSETVNPPTHEAVALADSLRAVPDVESAALADFLTFNDGKVGYKAAVPGAPAGSRLDVIVLRLDSTYFTALHIPLIAGRAFAARDDERAPRVVILAEGTARRFFPGQNAVGKTILLGGAANEVVGVVKDIKFTSLAAPAPDVAFQPLLQGENHNETVKLQVRSRMAPGEVAALVRNRIREARLPMSVESVSALEDAIGASLVNDRLRMQASSLFGALALLLIAAGVYGLMAYSVVRRTREIGIRMAVGSSSGKIVRLVMAESLRLVWIGIGVGLPGAVAVMKGISTMVFGLSPVDLASLGIAALILAATGAAAAAVPAWRAAHLDPVEALRVQ